jgi:hypothetical protein
MSRPSQSTATYGIRSLLASTLLVLAFTRADAQTSYAANGNVKTTIQGTSNIHDWEMTSSNGTSTMTLVMDAAGNLTGISNVGFQMSVKSLKSNHGNQMDNNAYKAMAADKYESIRFQGTDGTLKGGGGSYTLTVPGKLSIASGSQNVTLTANCKVNTDKSVSIDGSYRLNTNDYNVKPISIMLGALKTGEFVTIKYGFVARPQ